MNNLNCTNKNVPKDYFGFIYKTIFPNGKIYIGQSTRNINLSYFGSGIKVHSFLKTNSNDELKREI